MKTNIDFWSYLAQFFLEWEMSQIKLVEKIKHILCSITFFPRKSYRLWDNVEWYCTARQAIACLIPKATNKHSEYVILIAYSLQQWLQGRASMLRYADVHCLSYNLLRKLSEYILKTLYLSGTCHISVAHQNNISKFCSYRKENSEQPLQRAVS